MNLQNLNVAARKRSVEVLKSNDELPSLNVEVLSLILEAQNLIRILLISPNVKLVPKPGQF